MDTVLLFPLARLESFKATVLLEGVTGERHAHRPLGPNQCQGFRGGRASSLQPRPTLPFFMKLGKVMLSLS